MKELEERIKKILDNTNGVVSKFTPLLSREIWELIGSFVIHQENHDYTIDGRKVTMGELLDQFIKERYA